MHAFLHSLWRCVKLWAAVLWVRILGRKMQYLIKGLIILFSMAQGEPTFLGVSLAQVIDLGQLEC